MTVPFVAVTIAALILTGATPSAAQTRTPVREATQPAGRMIPVGTGVITGTVLSSDTGRPIRNARVLLSGQAGVPPAGRGLPPPTSANPPNALSISRTAFSDAQGQFTFARLAAGRYAVNVNRDGYLAASYGERRPNSGAFPAIELADGEQRTIAIAMSRGGVIAGHVFDEDGEPMRNVQIQVWRIDRSNGVKRLQQQNSATTNDRGAYRVFSLQPGNYLVSALPRNSTGLPDNSVAEIEAVERAIATGRVLTPASGGPSFVTLPNNPGSPGMTTFGRGGIIPAFLPVYFPGTLVATAARVIPITGFEQHEGLDITIQLVRATIIKGAVVPPPAGVPVQVQLTADDPLIGVTSYSTSTNQEDGTFNFSNVAPGRYTMRAETMAQYSRLLDTTRVVIDGKPVDTGMRIRVENPQAGAPGSPDEATRMWAQTEIVVNEEATMEVVLALRPARSISGRVEYDMASPPDLARAQQSINLQAIPGESNFQFGQVPQVRINADGTFVLNGVTPGRYFVRGPGTLRSIVLGGQDVLERPLEVKGDRDLTGLVLTVSDRAGEIAGRLLDASDVPRGNHVVVVAPVDERDWIPGSRRIMTTTTTPYGTYSFTLPPGDYVVSPVDDFENGAQYDPAFLATLAASGATVTAAEGRPVSQNFRIR